MKISKEKYFNSIKGHKIPHGHFELGSNLHIKDYYYAKRLFYNSFYTNRFAFLITRYILTKFDSLIDKTLASDISNPRDSIITLMGFENYSELLVSNVRKMLNDFFMEKFKLKHDLFNHDIYTKESIFLKNPDKIARNIICIFPISTTFSTSVKIQSEIKEILKKDIYGNTPIFHNPIINCIVISNRSLNFNLEFSEGDVEKQFGWENLQAKEKIVEMLHFDKHFFDNESNIIENFNSPSTKIQQKFFLHLQTEWQRINECSDCYPIKPIDEKCLVETKNSPVTPNLIFGYPKTIEYPIKQNIYRLFRIRKKSNKTEPVVYRKHFKKHGNNYIYYIRVGKFLQDNKTKVKKWLNDLRANDLKPLLDGNIVIVTPTLGSNSGFANLLNDHIFSDTATIIQYNPREEFLQNFKLFYSDILNNAEAVVFVDDVLSTTKSISDINFYIKNARSSNRGIDFCICLINRVGYYNFLKLEEKLKNKHDYSTPSSLLSFIDINVSPITYRNIFPYILLMDKFNELASKSVLDSMRIHFKEKENAIRPIDIGKEYDELSKENHPKALLQFLAQHEFNNIFQIISGTEQYKNHKLINVVFQNSTSTSYSTLLEFFVSLDTSNSLNNFLIDYPEYKYEIQNAIFKVCTLDPFIHHQFIREAAFKWVLKSLIEIVRGINDQAQVDEHFFQAKVKNDATAYSQYQNFKFLLKRGAKLKMNYIYSLDMLKAIRYILIGIEKYKFNTYYSREFKTSLLDESENKIIRDSRKTKPIFPIEFITYYVGLLEELIIEHESKALQLVVNIKKIIDSNLNKGGTGETLKNSYNDHFIHLLRLLVLENTFIFHTSSDKFLQKSNKEIQFSSNNYENFFSRLASFEKTYSFQFANYMLSRFENLDGPLTYVPEPASFASFQNMMLLKALLRNDLKDSGNEVPIKDKLTKVLQIICDILNLKDGGAFLAIKHRNRYNDIQEDDIAIVAEYLRDEALDFGSGYLNKESLLFRVFDGIREKNAKNTLSTFEVTLDDSYQYHFRENEQFTREKLSAFSEFQGKNKFKNIFYLRISEISLDDLGKFEAIPQAVICIYENPLNELEDAHLAKEFSNITSDLIQKEINFPKNDEKGLLRPKYERFDPKKIRQLLLLRNDLNYFINHHLNNDSLRAYIEILNKNKYYFTLKHGTAVYETLVKNYIRKLESSETLLEAKQHALYLKVAITYLINKLNLMSTAAKLFDANEDTYPITVTHTVKNVIVEFQKSCEFVLTMEQANLNYIEDRDFISFDASTIDEKYSTKSFRFCKNLLKELTFEILYNIKKHAVHPHHSEIKGETKIVVDLTVIEKDDDVYLCISNNFSVKSSSYIKSLSDNLLKRRNTDGLNLIYNIINIFSKKTVFLEQEKDVFKIYIPLLIID